MGSKRLTIGTSAEGALAVTVEGFDLPAGVEIIVRDFERGDEPDENGDLYEDEVLQTTGGGSE